MCNQCPAIQFVYHCSSTVYPPPPPPLLIQKNKLRRSLCEKLAMLDQLVECQMKLFSPARKTRRKFNTYSLIANGKERKKKQKQYEKIVIFLM